MKSARTVRVPRSTSRTKCMSIPKLLVTLPRQQKKKPASGISKQMTPSTCFLINFNFEKKKCAVGSCFNMLVTIQPIYSLHCLHVHVRCCDWFVYSRHLSPIGNRRSDAVWVSISISESKAKVRVGFCFPGNGHINTHDKAIMQVLATSCNVILYLYRVEHLSLNLIVASICVPQMMYHQLLKSRLPQLRAFEWKCQVNLRQSIECSIHTSLIGKTQWIMFLSYVQPSATFMTFIKFSGTYAFSKWWNRDARLPLVQKQL